ncbi:MAG: sulfite exporter TauE/SafE family protein [Burkholderiaceae bacterium]|nr:sulfite exporter TauE/SafE family protein [Burkholderiaceae bacterium]
MELTSIASLLLLGALTGFLAGLLGIGGGMVMIPFVTVLLERQGVSPQYQIQIAIATSLATILFTSISSVRAHHRRHAVLWSVAAVLAPGIAVGSVAGAQIAGAVRGAVLAAFFGVFIAWAATRMLRPVAPTGGAAHTLPGRAGMFAMGSVIGVFSALLGAGGAFLTVPFLVGRGVRPHSAVGTSAACGFPIAFAGTAGYVAAGWNLPLPAGTVGFVYLPALFAIAAASVLTAPLGARAAHALPIDKLKRVFGVTLYALAAYMMYKAWTLHAG